MGVDVGPLVFIFLISDRLINLVVTVMLILQS